MNFSDPILWMCVGVLLFGFVFMIWAIGRFRSKKAETTDDLLATLSEPDTTHTPALDLGLPVREKPLPIKSEAVFSRPAAAIPSSVLTPAFSKEVSDRLQSMTQHLADMQAVLSKQTTGAPAAAAPAGSIGQGLSSETIDKLLKIIGSVVSQVDVLQKSLNISKAPADAPSLGATPSSNAAPGSVFTAPPPSTAPKISTFPKP